MAVFRNVKTAFWTDRKVLNEMSPEDKYFFLYLLTNPQATQIGIYEFVPKSAAFYLGYSVEAVVVLLDRFQNKYDMIRYSNDTGEIAIKNYMLHSIIKGGKPVMDCLKKEASQIKDKSLLWYVIKHIEGKTTLNETVKSFISYIKEKEEEKDKDKDKDKERYVDISLQDKIDENFELLWSLYPRKKGKNSVSKKAKKEAYKIGYDHMARAIDRYAKENEKTDPQYIMYGSSFFNTGYVDYLDENYEPPKNSTEDAILRFLQRGD